MGNYICFTEEQKYRANNVDLADFLYRQGEKFIASGISMKQIQIWLGHSTFSTTADIYSHLDFHAQIESGLVMDGMFDRTPVDEPTGLEEDE